MFNHHRSAAKRGQGTDVNSRGFAFTPTTPAGSYTLGIIEQGSTTDQPPVRVGIEIINKTALTGGNPAVVVQATDEQGNVTNIATGTFAAGDTVRGTYLAYGRDTITLTFAPGTTSGMGAVFMQLSGIGKL